MSVLVGKMSAEPPGSVWESNAEVEGTETGLLLVEVDYTVLPVSLTDDSDSMAWLHNRSKCEGAYIAGESAVCIELDSSDTCNPG